MLVRAARRAAVASAAAPRRCTARRTSTVGDNRVVRLQTEDPRMSKIVIHNGVVYTSGQTAGDGRGLRECDAPRGPRRARRGLGHGRLRLRDGPGHGPLRCNVLVV